MLMVYCLTQRHILGIVMSLDPGGLEMGRANWNDHFIDGVLDDVAVFN